MENVRKNSGMIKAVTAVIFVSAALYAFGNTLIYTLINYVIDAFSLKGTAEGIMSSLLSAGMMIAQLSSPSLQGRIRKFSMIGIACLIQGVALLVCGIAAGPVLFGAGSFVLGLGCGWLDGYMNSIIIDLYPENSARPMLTLHALYGVGSLLTPVIVKLLLPGMGWRGPYFLVASFLIALTVIVFLLKKRTESTGALKTAAEEPLKMADIGRYLKKRRTVLLLLVSMLSGALGQTGILTWIVRYMTVTFDAESLGTTCITLFWVFATVNRLVVPNIKVKPMKMIVGGSFIFAAAVFIGVLSHNPVVMAVAVSVCGLCSGHFYPMLFMEAAEGYKGSTTMTTAVMQFVMGIGRVVIPLIAAFVSSISNASVGMILPGFTVLAGAVIGLIVLSDSRKEEIKGRMDNE